MDPSNQQPAADPVAALAEKVNAYLREKPIAGLAGTFAAGYVAGKLPIFRVAGGILRIVVPLVPPALALFGAAKVWKAVAPDLPDDRVRGSGPLNKLLSQALSARDAYDRAADAFDGEGRRLVEHLRALHDDAARQLKLALRSAGAAYAPELQPWPPLEVETGDGRSLADTPAFSIMLHAEEGWKHELEEALENHELGESHKTMLRRQLLPRAEEAVNNLLRHRADAAVASAGPELAMR